VKKEIKVFLVGFFVSGGSYAAIMTIWDLVADRELSLGKILFHFFFFGLVMGVFYSFQSKSAKKNLNQKGEGKNEQ